MSNQPIAKQVILGTAQLGLSIMDQLVAQGKPVTLVNRHGKINEPLPAGVNVVQGDVLDVDAVARRCADAEVIFLCAQPPYTEWPERWPPLMKAVLAGLARTKAKLVFGDNLYMYGLGNPVKFSDPSGHFSEDQLVGWYGKNWRDRFTPAWAKLLLDNPNSQIVGAQLGDLVVAGQGQQQQQMVFVLNQTGSLALWNVNTKIAQDATSVGSQTTDSLGLYRIANGETGSPGTRYGYLTGETQYLTGVNGNGTGPYTMKALAEYSTNLTSSEVMLEGNWFMGKGGQGYYVYNSMTFQGFNFGSTVSTLGSGGTTIGAVDLVQTLWKGQKPTGLGVIGTTISVATMIYGARMYRPTYTLSPCSSFGVNYCGAYR